MRLKTRATHHHIEEVFTPFGSRFDKAMGIATRLAICCFSLWCWNLCCYSDDELYYDSRFHKILEENLVSVILNMPAVPIMFELTVYFAAHFNGCLVLHEK
jgi:hypothetical protein